jgi:hypothetical protein
MSNERAQDQNLMSSPRTLVVGLEVRFSVRGKIRVAEGPVAQAGQGNYVSGRLVPLLGAHTTILGISSQPWVSIGL